MQAIIADDLSEKIRPLSRKEFVQLAELGAFEDERVELLFGVLVPMSPQGVPHCTAIERLMEILVQRLVPRARVRVQMPLAVAEHSQPEPDVAVVVRTGGDVNDHPDHPGTAYLVVEVADGSLHRDQKLKPRLYAACGVPEYWVVNLNDGCIEVHTEPSGEMYRKRVMARPGEMLRLVAFPDVEIAVSDVLGVAPAP